MVFACYLDEARTDAESAIVTMAGYIGPYLEWHTFEIAAAATFENFGVNPLHGYDFYNGKKEFKGWDHVKREAFAMQMQGHLARSAVMGITFSTTKAEFVAAKKKHGAMPNESPYGFCFRAIVNLLCNDPIMRMQFDVIPSAHISFVLEQGARNSEDAKRVFDGLKRKSPFRERLNSLIFAPKDSTKSLQMADFLAFYSRKYIGKYDEKVGYPTEPKVLTILQTGMHIEGHVAYDFELTHLQNPIKSGL
jgi:hypothetical protein